MDHSSAASTASKVNEYDKLLPTLEKVRDLKQSLSGFFYEYEHGQLSWTTVLDQMNVLSSQVANLRTSVRVVLPLLRTHSIVPMCLSPDNDPVVEQLTERRLSLFDHDFMPQLLRTKNQPEIEERERQLTANPSSSTAGNAYGRPMSTPNEIHARVQELNAVLVSTLEMLQSTKAATDKTEKQFDLQRFSNAAETKQLLDAMNSGTGLKQADNTAQMARNEQANLNQQMAAQPQRAQAPAVRIKTVAKTNR